MKAKLTFYNPYFNKVMLNVDGHPQPHDFWVNMIKGALYETTPKIHRQDVKFFVSFVDDKSAEVFLALPENFKLSPGFIMRLVDMLNTPYDDEGMFQLVEPSHFIIEPVSRAGFLGALSSCRGLCNFMD